MWERRGDGVGIGWERAPTDSGRREKTELFHRRRHARGHNTLLCVEIYSLKRTVAVSRGGVICARCERAEKVCVRGSSSARSRQRQDRLATRRQLKRAR